MPVKFYMLTALQRVHNHLRPRDSVCKLSQVLVAAASNWATRQGLPQLGSCHPQEVHSGFCRTVFWWCLKMRSAMAAAWLSLKEAWDTTN